MFWLEVGHTLIESEDLLFTVLFDHHNVIIATRPTKIYLPKCT